MVETVSILYFLYVITTIYISVMQIGYISKAKYSKALILSDKEFKKAGNYAISKERISIVERIFEYVLFLFWIGFGFSYLESLLSEIESSLMKSLLFVDIFILANWFFMLGFSLYGTFKLDREYGFSNMSFKLFAIDTVKAGGLFLIFGSLIIYLISYIIENFQNWWIYGFIFIFGVIIFINAIYPTLIAPIFNKFEPLEDLELKSKIENLLSEVGFKSSGVFRVDASRRDNRLNAYFGGLGKSKRVVLFDTLIQKLTHSELIAVLGHELGHFKHRDILKNIAIMGFILFVMFGVFGNLPSNLYSEIGVDEASYSTISLFLLLSGALTIFLMPIVNLISRSNEYRADEFGSRVGSREDLISALIKLTNENRAFPHSHKLYIFFYYSHPPLIERLKRLGWSES